MAAPMVVSVTEWVEYPTAFFTAMPCSAAAARSMWFMPVAAMQISRSRGRARSVAALKGTLLVMTMSASMQRPTISSGRVVS